MLYNWNKETFTWFQEASDYTGYNRNLAELIKPYLEGCKTILDLGCGMGLVDFELAPDFEEITCVDISEEPIGYIQNRAAKLGIPNLRAVCADGGEKENLKKLIPDLPKDAVLALFHGEVERIGETYLSYAAKKMILVVHGSAYGTTGPKAYRVRKCCDVDSTRAWLESHGLTYQFQEAELEFGQPHRSIEDAVAFTRVFTKNAPDEEIEEYARSHVIETGRDDFPFYTPKIRKFGLFAVDPF
ncbi:MAG: class I SAM-dependent methyltransferase [Parasporobacterium sp.]|nr:class I SAM-dependent methyltransferase [Parasporobacterium sp.]